ncbi:hypothetical protein V5O48_005701 [Marasmius crinis-equi]|uniref:Glycoside hydrolase family 44 catalytic domain-containing protein n=1 Tax=Marasmius crinis-equi TaxID=585013 RepID=A0ABR3FLL8_9AGAR
MAAFRTASLVSFIYSALLLGRAFADETIFVDNALSSTWQDWSWGSTISYTATDVKEGTTSISVTSDAWSALSFYDTSIFGGNFAGLKFDLAGSNPDISISLTDTATDTSSPSVPLSAFGLTPSTSSFTTYLLDFNSLPPNGGTIGNGQWNRITFQAGANGATYHLDNIQLVTEIVVTPQFLSAEPLGNNLIAVTSKGTVDLKTVKVTLNGKAVTVSNTTTYTPSDTPSTSISYLLLNSSLAPGTLAIAAGNSTFNFTLPSAQATTIDQSSTRAISPRVYGVNFPADASYIKTLGIKSARWGGNAVTAYNPFLDVTNAGNDWYFENRNNDDGNADAWVGWVEAAGADTFLTIPALDWVAKDNTSYSYPKTKYPNQAAYDPYNADAGNGKLADGSWVGPPDPSTVYTAWNTNLAKQWLSGLKNKPTFVHIDNEIEIASSTHQDMHPQPIGFDEELARVVNYSNIAKAALPNALVAAPSTCAWWFYWTSTIGYTDNAAHNNTDFLPWFLAQMASHDKTAGKRFLDYLDIHYYFQADTSANDAAAKALRLRMTRSWWDPTYVDESYIGTDTPQNHQPNATIVQLIPRMQALIAKNYPGTKLSVSEWASTADSDITGGLVTADTLGIFGKYGLDSATYWGDASATGPVGLAYWLYNGAGNAFGSLSAKATVTGFNPNILGVYAGTDGHSKPTLVIVNKDTKPVSLNLTGVPTGKYFIRHFGGAAGVAKYQTTQSLKSTSYLAVPAYTAVFLQYLS